MNNDTSEQPRRHWMGVLARAEPGALEDAWKALAIAGRDFTWIRRPETGMAMIRARTGGSGSPFHLGETTVTRCALRDDRGTMGVAYVMGRNKRHAELAASFDALLQDPELGEAIRRTVIGPLERAQCERRAAMRRRAAATKVDFFTMATEREDP